jgi:membrane-bound serine protease (ClpP class)
MLIRTESALEFLRISTSVILSTTIVTALFFFFLISLAIKGQKAKPITGIEGIIGEEGEALARLEPVGMVRVHGELWKAESVSGSIEEGERIKVKALHNLTLVVEQVKNYSGNKEAV